MQFITCGVNEGVKIGDNIKIEVLEIENNCVRLGITSNDEFPAYREHTLYLNEKSYFNKESFYAELQLQQD